MDIEFESPEPTGWEPGASWESQADCPDWLIEEEIEATRLRRWNAPHYRHGYALALDAMRQLRVTLRRAPRAPRRVGRSRSYARLASSSSDDGGDPDPEPDLAPQFAARALSVQEVRP